MYHSQLLLIVISLLVFWLIEYRHYFRIWITHRRSQPSVAKRRRKNKSLPHLLPTKRPDCPLCQAEEMLPSEVALEPPPLTMGYGSLCHVFVTRRERGGYWALL